MIGKKIKDLRKQKGWTQKDLAENSMINLSSIKQYEAGKSNPKFDNLIKLANALDVSYFELANVDPIDSVVPEDRDFVEWILHPTNPMNPKNSSNNITISQTPEHEKEDGLKHEIALKADLLNSAGKQKTIEYMDDLADNPKYKKDSK